MDTIKPPPPPPELDMDNLRATKLLGQGAMGTVFLVTNSSHLDPQPPFALKVFDKSSDHNHQADRRARHEISVLRRLSASPHPFLPHLIGTSENPDFISWAIPFCPGGDLNILRRRQSDGVFSTPAIRFYLAEVISAVEHLHGQGIVYRDLKPENILVQQSGHVTLTDFDLSRDLAHRKLTGHEDDVIFPDREGEKPAKQNVLTRLVNLKRIKRRRSSGHKIAPTKANCARVSPSGRRNPSHVSPADERSRSFVGTDEYVSPEMIRGDGHDFAVDWWALGVLCHEMLYGTTPFKGRNRKETYRNILFSEPALVGEPNPLTDLIRRLLEKDPTRRLGYRRGASEVKGHEFFRGVRWELVTEISRPPFLPDEAGVEEDGGIDVWEYFEKLKSPSSPLWSPTSDSSGYTDFLTEF